MRGRASARTWMESLDEINKRALTRQARVILSDGTDYSADQLQVARDTATWFDPSTRRLYGIPTTSIAFIHFRDGKRGTLRGLAGGMAAGALGGFVIGFASGDDPDDQFFAFSAAEKAVALGVVFGVLGAPVGAVVGSGSKISYRFDGGPIPKSPDLAFPTEPIASRPPGDVDPKVAPPRGDVDPIVVPPPEDVNPQAAPPPGDVDPQVAPSLEGAVLDTNPTPEDTSSDSENPPGDTVLPMERPPSARPCPPLHHGQYRFSELVPWGEERADWRTPCGPPGSIRAADVFSFAVQGTIPDIRTRQSGQAGSSTYTVGFGPARKWDSW